MSSDNNGKLLYAVEEDNKVLHVLLLLQYILQPVSVLRAPFYIGLEVKVFVTSVREKSF